MPLTELARNAKVMERLKTILAGMPEHLSARAMLEFGQRPESPELRQSLSANRINELVMPLFGLDLPGANLPAFAEQIDTARLELSRLRATTPSETRDFLASGEDFLAAAELYLDLTNKDSSIALQRLREASEARAAFQNLGRRLGLSDPVTEVE